MTAIPIFDDTVPVTCTASSDEIPIRIATIEHMRSQLRSITRTPHGLLLTFAPGDDVRAEVEQFTLDEKACCRFWGFEVHADVGGTTLRWDGPPTVSPFFDELVTFLESDQPATAFSGLLSSRSALRSGPAGSSQPYARSMVVPGNVTCSCCAGSFAEADVVRLGCAPEVAVCESCASSLPRHRVIPMLATDDVDASSTFWATAGFDLERINDDMVVAERFGIELRIIRAGEIATTSGACYLHLARVDPIHEEWAAAGLDVGELVDQPWGMREFVVIDPGDNHIRVRQNI